jgi:NAD(P)-dependent dehydrogenase (short-subunit alcohol dehydrogenase family)
VAGAEPLCGAVLVTEDEQGIAARLVEQLAGSGRAVALLRAGVALRETGPAAFEGDLDSEAGLAALLERVRQRLGPIAGLVHLQPLGRTLEPGSLEASRAAVHRGAQGLFLLARALRGDLLEAATRGGACLLVATGGSVGERSRVEPAPPEAAAAGLAKTLAREWPAVRVRVVALDPLESAAEWADRLVVELLAPPDEVQVAYRGGERLGFRAVPAPLGPDDPARLAPDSDWVMLLTGGGRGVTAAVARDLAARYRPTLVLVGQTALPSTPGPHAGLEGPSLRQALLMAARAAGDPEPVATAEAAARRVEREREIRRTLEDLQAVGARAQYVALDIRDTAALTELVSRIRRTYGRLDAVIHGAGVIEDRLVADKALASFERVFATKVDSALALAEALDPATLRLLVFFASTAGRLGNPGQGDYGAANEVLTALAADLDRRWSGRVVSVSWGPWEGVGMVTSELARDLARRGMTLLAPGAGLGAFDQEITRGAKGDAAVILAADAASAEPLVAGVPPGVLAVTTPGPDTNGALRGGRDSNPSGSRSVGTT